MNGYRALTRVLIFAMALVLGTDVQAATAEAKSVVEELHTTLLDVMKRADALGYSGRYDTLAPVVSASFDFDTIGQQLLGRYWAGLNVRDLIREFEAYFPKPLQPTWVFGNHDRPRLIERLGGDSEKAKLLTALQLTARGVPVIYYGDELGLPHHELPLEGALDPVAAHFRFVPHWLHATLRKRGILLNRDSCQSPMPWHAGRHAGFSPPDVRNVSTTLRHQLRGV